MGRLANPHLNLCPLSAAVSRAVSMAIAHLDIVRPSFLVLDRRGGRGEVFEGVFRRSFDSLATLGPVRWANFSVLILYHVVKQ